MDVFLILEKRLSCLKNAQATEINMKRNFSLEFINAFFITFFFHIKKVKIMQENIKENALE